MIQNVTHCSGNIACLIPKYICTVPKHFVFVSIRKSHDCHTEHYNTEQTFFPRNSIKHSFFLKKVRFSKAKIQHLTNIGKKSQSIRKTCAPQKRGPYLKLMQDQYSFPNLNSLCKMIKITILTKFEAIKHFRLPKWPYSNIDFLQFQRVKI